ncbi:hypothetical protein [Nonomuraea sp. bgisy101]|uniref:hypothetical protein n=1 Tax=Nonomuraea sp. bgisy101 TaxID=3413784 RepID=UPI003D756C6E
MPRLSCVLLVCALVAGVPTAAHAVPMAGRTPGTAVQAGPGSGVAGGGQGRGSGGSGLAVSGPEGGKPTIEPVARVRVPAAAQAAMARRPSPATEAGAGRPDGPGKPAVTVPAGPALVDKVVAEAEKRMAGPSPSSELVLPDAEEGGLSLLPAKKGLKLPFPVTPDLPVVRDGVPLMTFKLCAAGADLPAACSSARPVGTPVQADVTGDGMPDLLATLVPQKAEGDSVGIGFGVVQLGGPVKAQVWAEYAVASDKVVKVGFDGYRRGSTLAGRDWGSFTVDLSALAKGRIDVRATVRRSAPGSSAATIAGLEGKALLSLRQTPATERFSAHARIDGDTSALTATASANAELDALVVAHRRRFTQVTVDKMGAELTAELTRPGDVHFTSSSPIARAGFHDYVFRDGKLSRAAGLSITRLPREFRATARAQGLSVSSGSPRAKAADLSFYDATRDQTVVSARLTGLPAKIAVEHDAAANTIVHTASSALGGLTLLLQRGQGAIASPPGNHVTMIKDGARLGVSGRLTGVAGFEVRYGATPRVKLALDAGGGPFTGAADIDGTHLARLEISNTPAKVSADLDPEARTAAYTANGTIERLRASYANPKTGLSVDGSVRGVRGSVKASWALGPRTTVDVTTPGRLGRIDLHAAAAQGVVRASVKGVRGHLTAVADTEGRRLGWTADAPVSSVVAWARAGELRAAFTATGVPARWEATWSAPGTATAPSASPGTATAPSTPPGTAGQAGAAVGGVRFRGLSGPIGSATIAVANHEGATAPAGPHLAAHYDAATGRFDAGVRLDGLRKADLTQNETGTGFTADVQAARRPIAVDADLRTATGDGFGARAVLGPAPGRVAVSSANGRLTYDASDVNLTGQVWLGNATAVPDAPRVKGGVSLVDGGTPARPGVRAFVDLKGLPGKVDVDLAGKTFTFSGFRPAGRRLALYLDSRVLAPVPIRASATLTGLPSAITSMTVGPFGVQGQSVTAAYKIEPAATLGTLDVRAETGEGRLRGRVVVDPVPAAVSVTGVYGGRTRIRVHNSARVERLEAAVTSGEATGLLRFTDVPSVFGVDADSTASALRLPNLTYKANAGTLDGLLAVQAGLIEKVYQPPQGRVLDTFLEVGDLGADTTARLNPDLSVDLVSKPAPTRLLRARTGLDLQPVAAQRVSSRKDVPYAGGFLAYRLDGQFGLGPSRIDDVTIAVHKMSWLRIRPGKVPFGASAPPAVGFVSPGFEGGYDRLDLRASGVDLRPDVRLDVKVTRSVGADVFDQRVRMGRTTSLRLRRYDQRMRPISSKQAVKAGSVPLACVTVGTKPGVVPARRGNALTLRGADGPQMVSLLDPGGQAPGYAIDLLTHFMSPFPGAEWKVSSVEAGRCDQ